MTLEAVLANDGILASGSYRASFKIMVPAGLTWERHATITLPQDDPLSVPILREKVCLEGPAGEHTIAAQLSGGAARGDRATLTLSREDELPRLEAEIAVWGLETSPANWLSPVEALSRLPGREISVEGWLADHGVCWRPLAAAPAAGRDVMPVGRPWESDPESWRACLRRVEGGATAIFLVPLVRGLSEDSTHWLPLQPRGGVVPFYDWLYHEECVGKAHPVFDGLPSGGLLWGSYRSGATRLVLNSLRVLERLDRHPAADRLLLNLIHYAARAS